MTNGQGEQDGQVDIDEVFYQGSDLHGEGRHAEAMACFERCLAMDPTYADALLGKAMVHMARSEFAEAIACAERICELAPEDVLAWTNLSVFHQRAGNIPAAEEAAARAKVLDWKKTITGGA